MLLSEIAGGVVEDACHLFRLAKEGVKFFPRDGVEVGHGDFPVAGPAEVFWGVGTGIHLLAAGAPSQIAEGVGGELAGFLVGLELFFENLIHLIPQLRIHDGFAFDPAPFFLGFLDASPTGLFFESSILSPNESLHAPGTPRLRPLNFAFTSSGQNNMQKTLCSSATLGQSSPSVKSIYGFFCVSVALRLKSFPIQTLNGN